MSDQRNSLNVSLDNIFTVLNASQQDSFSFNWLASDELKRWFIDEFGRYKGKLPLELLSHKRAEIASIYSDTHPDYEAVGILIAVTRGI